MMFKNMFIYVSDSLRFDYTPKDISNLGLSYKCVAPAPFSHPSFSSLMSGIYPETYRVYNKLFDKITGPTIFDHKKFNTGYWAESPYDSLYTIFKKPKRIHLNVVKEPFILLERSLDSHAPYGSNFNDVSTFYKMIGNDYDELLKYYRIGIEKSQEKFNERLQTLEKRKLLEDTLVIFTSDYGELFNEYNRPGHILPLCPELIFVPCARASKCALVEEKQLNEKRDNINR